MNASKNISVNGEALGSAVMQALVEGATALHVARGAADALADGDTELANRMLYPYRRGAGTLASDLVFDHPAQSVEDALPAEPTGTTGY
jgi:hypothetical protein